MKWVQQWVNTRRTIDEAVVVQSCLFYVLPRHTNIVTDKGFNLFDICAGNWVHMSPQEEECTSFSWGDSKMYTSGKMANSFRIILNKIQISLPSLSWWYFSCLRIQIFFFLLSKELFFPKSLYPRYTNEMKWNIFFFGKLNRYNLFWNTS